ncbi:hypothetical protein ACFLX7_00915 [Chloroflexota bacterium]
MINRNIDYNIVVEAEAVAAAYDCRKPAHIDITDKEWEVASSTTRNLLIHIQQLAKCLGESYLEAEGQGNHEQATMLYQILKERPCLSSIDLDINDLYQCVENEIEFTVNTRLWIKETKIRLYQGFLQD